MRTCQCMSHFVYNLRSRPLLRDLAARVHGQIAFDHCKSDLITGPTHWAWAGYPFPEVNLPENGHRPSPGSRVASPPPGRSSLRIQEGHLGTPGPPRPVAIVEMAATHGLSARHANTFVDTAASRVILLPSVARRHGRCNNPPWVTFTCTRQVQSETTWSASQWRSTTTFGRISPAGLEKSFLCQSQNCLGCLFSGRIFFHLGRNRAPRLESLGAKKNYL